MKTLIAILIVLGVVGYNIWVFFENKDIDKYNKAIRDYENSIYDKSFLAFDELCEQKSDAASCYMLGLHYDNGHGVDKDQTKAANLYQKACDKDDKDGCHNLAISYYNGEGVKRDIVKSIEILNNLCKKDRFERACNTLKEINSDDNESQTSTQASSQNVAPVAQNWTNESSVNNTNNEPVGSAAVAARVEELLSQKDAQLNRDYKQIMSQLSDDQKNEFKNMQRAWVKFASNLKEFLNIFNLSQDEKNAYYLDILINQTDFLTAVAKGEMPSNNIQGDINKLKSRLDETLNDVNSVLGEDKFKEFQKVQNAWEKYIALKRTATNKIGLDADLAYRQGYASWIEWLKIFATDMI